MLVNPTKIVITCICFGKLYTPEIFFHTLKITARFEPSFPKRIDLESVKKLSGRLLFSEECINV